jgi:hypothetical protein
MWLLEEVATIDENVGELRRRRGRAFAQRNARSVRELQTLGIADPDFNPLLAATALPAMVGTDGLYDLPRRREMESGGTRQDADSALGQRVAHPA